MWWKVNKLIGTGGRFLIFNCTTSKQTLSTIFGTFFGKCRNAIWLIVFERPSSQINPLPYLARKRNKSDEMLEMLHHRRREYSSYIPDIKMLHLREYHKNDVPYPLGIVHKQKHETKHRNLYANHFLSHAFAWHTLWTIPYCYIFTQINNLSSAQVNFNLSSTFTPV